MQLKPKLASLRKAVDQLESDILRNTSVRSIACAGK